MKRNLALLTITLLLPLSSFAQYSLIGQVTDETGTSIQGAQLCLYQDGELAGLAQSNAKGEYRIGDVPRGSYQVVASCVGYSSDEDSVVIDRDANLNFILMTKSVELDSVVVTGSSSRATSKGHVFYLTKKAKECGNPFVALQEIPLLYSDPVNESVRSADGQSMLILVDGMRVNSGVSPIDPARIKSVEIIDVVSAKYMRQGVKRVVNIKLKDTSLYTYAQLSTRADYPAKSYFAMPTFEIGNSTVSLYGDASISTEHSRQENAYSLVTPGLTKHYAGERRSKSTDYDFSLMGKWRMTAKDYFAAYVQGNISKENSSSFSLGEQNAQGLVRDNASVYRSHLFSATAYYKHLFSEDEELELYAVYTDNRADNTNSLEEETQGLGGTNLQQYISRHHKGSLTLSYSKEFDDGGSLELGNETEYAYDRIENNGLATYLFGHHRLNEFVFAGYTGMLSRKLTYDVTAGMEYMAMRSDSIDHHYFRPRFDLGLHYNITNTLSMHLGYTYSNTAPSVAMLSPYNTSADTLLISRGNPFLLPSKSHVFSWNTSYYKGSMSCGAGVSYGVSSDLIESVRLAADNGVLLTTYQNQGRFRSLQLKGNLLWRVLGCTVLMDMAHHVSYYTSAGAKKYFRGLLLVSKKWGKLEARANFSYQNYIVSEYARTKNYNPTSTLMLSYSFTPDILLSVGCTSFIGNPRSKTTVSTGDYRSVAYTKSNTFSPWVLFRWTIRKNSKRKIDLDNDILRDHEGKFKL